MTRMVRIDVEYCILLTPARSAAAYAHQVHRNAMIVGLKSSAIACSRMSNGKVQISKFRFSHLRRNRSVTGVGATSVALNREAKASPTHRSTPRNDMLFLPQTSIL
jgi:hypothetical protein